MMPPIHPLGAAIAIFFVTALASILWWMLHPPAHIPLAIARARQSVASVKRILVPTIGLPYAERGVELACRLGLAQKAEILLTYVMEVPRTMPLGIQLIEAEKNANEVLDRAEAIVELHHLQSEKIFQRARLAGEEISKIAQKRNVDMIVLGVRPKKGLRGEIFGKTSDSILRHAPCEVIIATLPDSGT